jgi:hypothetical protein
MAENFCSLSIEFGVSILANIFASRYTSDRDEVLILSNKASSELGGRDRLPDPRDPTKTIDASGSKYRTSGQSMCSNIVIVWRFMVTGQLFRHGTGQIVL